METRYDIPTMREGRVFPGNPKTDRRTGAHGQSIFDPAANHLERAVAIISLDDIDTLVTVATSALPSSLRNDALSRIDEIRGNRLLTENHLAQLALCLDESDLIAHTVALMDDCGYEWSRHCTADTIEALTAAIGACRNISEAVVLEDALLYIACSRPDLSMYLRARRPDASLTHGPLEPCPNGKAVQDGVLGEPLAACG